MKPLFILLFLPLLATAQALRVSGTAFAGTVYAPAPVVSWLVHQNFEGTGYDNSETWTESGTGTVDEDYTATVLDGSQSLSISMTSGSAYSCSPAFAAQGELWVYFKIRPVDISGAGNFVICAVNQSLCTDHRATLTVLTTGSLRIAGSSTGDTVGTLSEGTTYHVWFHYKKGTGVDAVVDVGFSTDGIRPTSGNNFVQITGQTMTADITKFQLMRDAGSATQHYIFDKVRADDVQIGDNPP